MRLALLFLLSITLLACSTKDESTQQQPDGVDVDAAIAAAAPIELPNELVDDAHSELQNVEAVNQVVHLYLEQDRFAEARFMTQGALKHHPDDPEARTHLAVVRIAEGNRDEAKELLDKVLAEHDELVEAHVYRGIVDAWTDNQQAAVERWKRALILADGKHERLENLLKLASENKLPSAESKEIP